MPLFAARDSAPGDAPDSAVPLGKAPLPIQFGGGVDNRTDSKQVPTTKLLDLQNCVFTKLSTLSKRNGHRAFSTQIQSGGGDIANARGLAERDGEVLLFTDKRCYSYRPSGDRWADAGEVAASTCTTLPIARTGTYQTQPDVADRNGIRVAAWEDSRGGLWCSVFEAETGRVLLSQFQLDSSSSAKNVRCMPVGEVLHVLWTREDLGQIFLAIINPSMPDATPVPAVLTSDLDATKPFYDAEAAPAGPNGIATRPGIIAWAQAGGGFRVGYIDASGVLGSAATGLPSVVTFTDLLTGPIAVAHNPSDVIVAVAWIGGASVVRARTLSATALTTSRFYDPVSTSTGYTRIAIAWGALGPNGATLLYWAAEVTAARSDLTSVDSGSIDPATLTIGAVTKLRGHGLVSRAWHDGGDSSATASSQGGDVYVMVAHTARFFPYVAALRLSDDSGINSPSNTIVARLMPGECAGSLMRVTGSGTRAWTQHLPSVTQQDLASTDIHSRSHAVCLPYRIQLSSQNGDQFSEQGLKHAILNQLPAYRTAQLGRGLYLASAAPMHYDGEVWREADFHCAPDYGYDTAGAPVDMSAAVTMVATGSIANGTYLYAYWYEAVDAQGELHRGPVSTKLLVTMSGGPRSFSHAIPTCRLTKFANVRICVARSQQGATGTDQSIPLYKVTSNDVTVTAGSNRYVLNDPTVDTVTFVDGLDDASLIKREPLYTNGGVLSNAPSPWAGGVIATGKGRMYWTDPTDPHMVRYSQQADTDTALEAPIDLSLRKDPFGGAVTAIGVMDDTVIPLSETAVWVFGGPGPLANPNAAPEANAFTPIELISTDVGCTQAASVGVTPVGITFKSAKGIMMLTRDRKIVNIGNDVQKYDDQDVTRATLIPTAQRIVYLTSSGRSLMWDYNRDAWSTFTNHEGLDAVLVDNLYCYLRNDSRVFIETPGIYKDDNSSIPMVIETAWIHFAPYLQGWQKILWAYFLGRFVSAHTLSVRFRLDYNEGYSPAILNDVNANYNPSLYGAGAYGAGAYGGPGLDGSRYQRRIHINRRCQAISFLISDVEATGDFGASFELSELLLIGGGIGTDFKLGEARSA